jgi:hypothetical protein
MHPDITFAQWAAPAVTVDRVRRMRRGAAYRVDRPPALP